MDGCSRNREICPKLFDLIPQRRKWYQEENNNTDEEQKLELRLAPPGGDEEDHSEMKKNTGQQQQSIKKESVDKSVHDPYIFQKRTASGPVVGWPPVRSFRKNLASISSSKLGNESFHGGQINKTDGKKNQEELKKEGMFIKINMDGVSIGRKVNLNAYNSYQQLSVAVDKLFRSLLAVQSGEGVEKPIVGLLDGKGDFTLTYEDNEGDKMLVGDVPWPMFISSVKRLRVIKSSEISVALTFGSSKEGNMRN